MTAGATQSNARFISMKLLECLLWAQTWAVFSLLPLVVVAIHDDAESLQIFRFGEKELFRRSFSSSNKRKLFLHALELVAPLVPTSVTGFAFQMVLQESKDALDHFAARKFCVAKLKSQPSQSHLGFVPVDL